MYNNTFAVYEGGGTKKRYIFGYKGRYHSVNIFECLKCRGGHKIFQGRRIPPAPPKKTYSDYLW